MSEMIERVADALEAAELGWSIELTRLVDGVPTYTARVRGQTREFEDRDDASVWVQSFVRQHKARAAIQAMDEPTRSMRCACADADHWPRSLGGQAMGSAARTSDQQRFEQALRMIAVGRLWALTQAGALDRITAFADLVALQGATVDEAIGAVHQRPEPPLA